MSAAAGYDVVIAGSGIAGLATAARLATAGNSVLVVEKAPTLGGSTRMSGGTVWTASSMEAMGRYVPGGDRRKQQHLVDGIDEGLEWLRSLGVEVEARRETSDRVISQVDVEGLTLRLAGLVQARGGDIAAGTALVDLRVDAGGAVTGAFVSSGDDRWLVPASAVVLATGGFQGSPTLLARHVPGHTDRLFLRSNPDSTGDGLVVALGVGATTSPDMASFYGHTIPETSEPLAPDRWTSVTPYYSQDAVLVDMEGERFFDESLSAADERAPMALVRRPSARGVLVFDDALYSDTAVPDRPPGRVRSSFETAASYGALAATADTLDDLAASLAGWGVDPHRFLDTIGRYNAATASSDDGLTPPRARHRIPVTRSPFRALIVRPAITFTLGGIAVDDHYRVTTSEGSVVPGLFAAGADVGGVYEGGYAGGLVLGLVQSEIVANVLASS